MEKLNLRQITLIGLFLLFFISLYLYPALSGLTLIFALIIFGSFAALWKEPGIRLSGLAALILLCLLNVALHGIKFGIDFSGGTRIPIILEKSVDPATMNDLLEIIKKRVSVLGLTEVKVRAVGDGEIVVELPSSDAAQLNFIESTLAHQGVYKGIVDGEIAISGEDIYTQTVQPIADQRADWAVAFTVNKKGAENFAAVVKGKGNYPVYMFIDRPGAGTVWLYLSQLKQQAPSFAKDEELLKAASDALHLKSGDISVFLIDEMRNNSIMLQNITASTNKSKAILPKTAPPELKTALKEKGFVLIEVDDKAITPFFSPSSDRITIDRWEAVGLLSSPILNPSITTGIPSYNYEITGSVSGLTPEEKSAGIRENVKRIESILKGGSLPVSISTGSRTSIPATHGAEFLRLSAIGVIIALLVTSFVVAIRYRVPKLVLPVIATSISELIILISILGSFTIDLAAMAGIIAAIGVGLDSQIVITDELLKKEGGEFIERISHAFNIVKTSVVVAVVAMIPLLFSGLVEIIGFAISSVLGALLGYLLTRPAYAALAEKIVGVK